MNNLVQLKTCYSVMMIDENDREWAVSIHDTEAEAEARADLENVKDCRDCEYYVARVTYTEDPSMPLLGESEEYEIPSANVPLTDEEWCDQFGPDED